MGPTWVRNWSKIRWDTNAKRLVFYWFANVMGFIWAAKRLHLPSRAAGFIWAARGLYLGSEGASTKMFSAKGARNPTEHNSGPVRAQFGFRIFLYLILYFSVEKNKERTTKHLKQREKTRRTPETKPEKNQERN